MKNNKRILPRRGECNDQQQQEQNLHDPFHSYFESYYENAQAKDLTRGESANIFGQSSEDVTVLTDRRRHGQQSQRKLLETATTTGHRRLEELMAARGRYLERPDEPQQVDHGGDRDAYDDVGIPEYDEGFTRDHTARPRHSRPHRSTQTVRQHQRKQRSPLCRRIVLPRRRRI